MIEKVNPSHPDKLADRIAGALVDLAYTKQENPKIAVEVLLGHGMCHIICESSVGIEDHEADAIVRRIAGEGIGVDLDCVPQDVHLSKNQSGKVRCGDNGIFCGMPLRDEDKKLSQIAREIYKKFPTDGKYILDGNKLIICQSHCNKGFTFKGLDVQTNPLGPWTGGPDVDTGATNRKLGSDMAQSVTGGGLHGKDLSKADVSVNIYAFCMAQANNAPVQLSCAIGDDAVGGVPYDVIVEFARDYINRIGGFEKFAEWGLY